MGIRERLAAQLWPPAGQSRRRVRFETIAVLSFASVAMLAGRCCTANYAERSTGATVLWWAMFLARTLEFHVALLVSIAALLCVRERLFGWAACCLPLIALGLGPDLCAVLLPRAGASPGRAMRVVSANLLMVNKDTAGIVGEIVAARPDLLLVQELTDAWHAAIDPAVRGWLPHSSFVTRDDSFGIGIWSRRPFVGEPERYVRMGQSHTPQQRAVVDFDGVPVVVYNLHLLPPRTVEYVVGHCREMRDLGAILGAETRNAILCGDFNFTERTPQAATLAALGFADAQDQGGSGRGATWPVIGALRYTFPGIRLDHVYLKGALSCRTLSTGTGRGSDHRPLIADLVVTGPK